MDLAALWQGIDFRMLASPSNMLGLAGGICYIASVSMKTVVPLRLAGIASTLLFLLSAIMARSIPSMFLYAVLLPLNIVRLIEINDLIRKVRLASSRDLSMDWLEPFMSKRAFEVGDPVLTRGDKADEMFLVVSGLYRVEGINVDIGPGHIFGELGILTPGNTRTHSITCVESGRVLTLTYDKLRELYFENPEFGFHMLRLTGERLLSNVTRLEGKLAAALSPNESKPA